MRIGRGPWRRRLRRLVLVTCGVFLMGTMLATGAFLRSARGAVPDFTPVHDPLPAEVLAFANQTPDYTRPESSTYLTFPEWYLVFNPQEYAQYLAKHAPSGFPYFQSIRQFWGGYAQVYGVARRHYPFNFGNHVMLVVIGTSSTGEWLIKGIYENTLGRVSEWISSGGRTTEDDYAAQVAREYGELIPTEPWFVFPYGRAFTGLWTKNPFFGPHFPRKVERKFSLSIEYGVKFFYAGLIRLASRAAFGVAATEIHATLTHADEAAVATPGVQKVRDLGGGAWIVTVPHYQGFTDTVPLLARRGADFIEVAGNDEILATVVAPRSWAYDLTAGRVIFEQPLLNGPDSKRLAVQVPIRALGNFLREAEAKHLRLEHLFDY